MRMFIDKNKSRHGDEVIGCDLILEHDGKFLGFKSANYAKIKDHEVEDFLYDINHIWSKMDSNIQLSIFNIYVDFQEALEEISNKQRLTAYVKKLVKNLYDLHDHETILNYVLMGGKIRFPQLDTVNTNVDNRVETTYLARDYKELTALAIMLRPMVPIWCSYMTHVKNEVGSEFKEFDANTLLLDSYVPDLPSYQRLHLYISTYIREKESEGLPLASKIGGLGTILYPDWLMALVIIRKVATCPITHTFSKDVIEPISVIKNVYNYLRSKIDKATLEKAFGGRIHNKYSDGKGSEEDNTSHAEAFKVKMEVSDAAVLANTVYVEDIERLANLVNPLMNKERLNLFLNTLKNQRNFDVQEFQKIICQLVISKGNDKISSKSIPELEYGLLLNMLAVIQNELWERGFYDIAYLLTASPTQNNEYYLQPSGKKRQIPLEIEEKLKKLNKYPRKPKNERSKAKDFDYNQSKICIDELVELMEKTPWKINLPLYPENCTLVDSQDGKILSYDIKIQLAEMLIYINENKE